MKNPCTEVHVADMHILASSFDHTHELLRLADARRRIELFHPKHESGKARMLAGSAFIHCEAKKVEGSFDNVSDFRNMQRSAVILLTHCFN